MHEKQVLCHVCTDQQQVRLNVRLDPAREVAGALAHPHERTAPDSTGGTPYAPCSDSR